MANILKDGKTYTDERGVVYTSPYMIINNTVGTSTPTQAFSFSVEIYASIDTKNNGYKPTTTQIIFVSPTDINTYLVTSQTANTTESPLGFAKKWVYTYLGTVEPDIPGVVWLDWKSDVLGGVPQ